MQAVQFHWSPWMDAEADGGTRFLKLCEMAEAQGFASIRVPSVGKAAAGMAERAARSTREIGIRLDYEPGLVRHCVGVLGERLVVQVNESGLGVDLSSLAGVARIDVEADSSEAALFAIKHGSCLFRRPDRAEQVRGDAMPVRHFGKQAGISTYLLARDTHAAALRVAEQMVGADASNWLTPRIWHGALPGRHACGMLVDSYEGIASTISEYRASGITQFLVNASGDMRELEEFAGMLRGSFALA